MTGLEIDRSPVEILWFLSWLGAVLTVPSVLLQRAGRPTAALSWLLALFAVPVLALLAWWLFGRIHLRRRKRQRRQASQTTTTSLRETKQRLLAQSTSYTGTAPVLQWRVAKLPLGLEEAVFPPAAGNKVTLLPHTKAAHSAWFSLVRQARHHLHLLFYIWCDDSTGRALRDCLVEKAHLGVEIRVLFDAVGSFKLPHGFFEPLLAAGGKVASFMPIRLVSSAPTLNFRNHRKLLIADGQRAFTGGINVGNEYLQWQDLGIIIEGPGVNQMQEIFVDDWYFSTGEELDEPHYFCAPAVMGPAFCETIASGPDQMFNAIREMTFLAITQCRKRLWIATPYFVPDQALLLALRTAVYRGVDVRLMLPRTSDVPLVQRASRVFYRELLASGLRIDEYEGMLHVKAMLLDYDTILVGSANLDIRSFRLNFEISTFVTDPDLNLQLSDFFDRLLARSRTIVNDDLQRTTYMGKLRDVLAHLLSPLL